MFVVFGEASAELPDVHVSYHRPRFLSLRRHAANPSPLGARPPRIGDCNAKKSERCAIGRTFWPVGNQAGARVCQVPAGH
jgi:hypothetical protein